MDRTLRDCQLTGARAPLPVWLRAIPALTFLAMLGPVAAGLWGTVLPALGHLPAAGHHGFGFTAIAALLDWPGLATASRLSITTGAASTLIALAIVTLVVAGWSGTRAFRRLERLLAPLLSVPHAAAAFGLAFLIAPSGWIARLAAPLIGLERPTDLLIVHDPLGLAMVAGLVAKEVPFLLLMTLAALTQIPHRETMANASALGYRRTVGWLKAVFPQVYAQIRLPVYVVLAYAMSVVDVALILGPTTPPTLSVQIVAWMGDPDLSMRLTAAAAALLQLALVGLALVVWRCGEIVVARLGRRWATGGGRGGAPADAVLRGVGVSAGTLCAAAVLAGLASLVLWSLAAFWRFPAPLPGAYGARNWARAAPDLAAATVDTARVATVATALAVILAIGCLHAEERRGTGPSRLAPFLLYLPLLVPQTAFLPGLQTFLLGLGADVGLWPVIAAHLVFVLPYVFLALADPWRAWDARQGVAAAALGAGPMEVLFRVKLPMLLRPVLAAAAIGMAVSVGQYLPTLLIGGGRVATLTTEAVALASGGDRRAIGVWSVATNGCR